MPRYYEDKPEGGACAGVKEDLGACLLRSDCVLKEGKSPRQCLKEGNCKALKYSFFECKRSMELHCKSLPFVDRRSQVYRTFMTQEATRRT
ncbi:cytochrome c oxidase assembly factor 5 isoform X2 [Equus przewalskii]|uniref:Cytochrome c oxidase assembly factor 5 n=1 Tax=Equus przewalskii TaxID=9798 RepID=A0ABM4KN56_EQUPR|nr:cytochrome c oxidase assembly factor 5 isoform X2 [Equus asinus]